MIEKMLPVFFLPVSAVIRLRTASSLQTTVKSVSAADSSGLPGSREDSTRRAKSADSFSVGRTLAPGGILSFTIISVIFSMSFLVPRWVVIAVHVPVKVPIFNS